MNIVGMIFGLRSKAVLKMRAYFESRLMLQLDSSVYINLEQLEEKEAREVLRLALWERLIDRFVFFALVAGLALAFVFNWSDLAADMYAHPSFVLLLAALLILHRVEAPRLNER